MTEEQNNGKKVINPAAEALKKPNPFADGTFDGTTRIKEKVIEAPENPNKGKINIIDGEEFEVPANTKIEVQDPDNPDEIIEVDNTSRGRLGFVSNPEKIAELKAQGIPVNDNAPLTPSVQELQKKFDEEKLDKAKQKRIKEQKAVKNRCIIQNAPYNPPEDLKDVPSLAPWDPNTDNVQNVQPEANKELGEVILDDGSSTNANTSTGQKQPSVETTE